MCVFKGGGTGGGRGDQNQKWLRVATGGGGGGLTKILWLRSL